MVNEPTEEELVKLAEQLGLNKPTLESSFGTPLFQGDFGHSIDLLFLIAVVLLIFIVIFLIIYIKMKRK